MTDNLALWNAVERTDPEQVKPITGKPYKGTSPNPYFLVHEATKTFGPCGIGWGFQIVSERVEDSGKGGDKVHIAHVRVWYVWEGTRGEVEHIGQTMFSGTNKNGLYTDEDAPKKSVTDALVKALSMIGFAGDIFMGRYDDSKYVEEIREEFRAAPGPSLMERCEAVEKAMMSKETPEALTALWHTLADDMKEKFRARFAKVGAELKAKAVPPPPQGKATFESGLHAARGGPQ